MLIFSNCYFANNYSPSKGGAISYGNSRFTAYTTVRFVSCKFIGNRAKEGGGAISLWLYDGFMIEHCDFIDNQADESGSGSIYIETDFQCKNANLNGYLDIPQDRNPNIEILNCNFRENNKGLTSSCILIDKSSKAPIKIDESTFIDCGFQGNVIDIKSDVKSFVAVNSKIEFTSSNSCGGISINSKGIVTISNFKFIQTSRNSALSIASSSDSSDQISLTN